MCKIYHIRPLKGCFVFQSFVGRVGYSEESLEHVYLICTSSIIEPKREDLKGHT